MAQGGLRGGQHHGAAGGAVLHGFENAEEQALARRREQVNAIEIGEAGKGGRIGVGDQPFAGIAALKGGCGQWRAAEEIVCQGLLAGAVLAFNGGHLHVGRGHISLHEQLAPGGADAHNLQGGRRLNFNEGEAGDGGLGLELSGGLHGSQRASPPWPNKQSVANRSLIGGGAKNMNRRDGGIFAARVGRCLVFFGPLRGLYRKRLEGSSEKI